jgi:membrane associated rhomboid family serine protease
MAFLTEPPKGPAIRAPAIVLLLIALILGIELSREFIWYRLSDFVVWNFGFVPARYSGAGHMAFAVPGWIGDLLPWITYNFLHGSFTHVAVNSVWLLAFGAIVGRRLGTIRFLVFFLVCGVAAAALHLALNWNSTNPVLGASGAIAGLMAAGIRLGSFTGEDDEILRPLTDRTVLSFTGFWMVANVVAGLIGLGAGPGQVIAWQAHIGGYFAGLFLIGWAYRPPPPLPEDEAQP